MKTCSLSDACKLVNLHLALNFQITPNDNKKMKNVNP